MRYLVMLALLAACGSARAGSSDGGSPDASVFYLGDGGNVCGAWSTLTLVDTPTTGHAYAGKMDAGCQIVLGPHAEGDVVHRVPVTIHMPGNMPADGWTWTENGVTVQWVPDSAVPLVYNRPDTLPADVCGLLSIEMDYGDAGIYYGSDEVLQRELTLTPAGISGYGIYSRRGPDAGQINGSPCELDFNTSVETTP